ncbi:urease accessory protein UreD [Arthrobacter russicus]|jgi:urease accessory protein|uniref:Urease accessory protein UreD n=1 Tax=Arthrobacter russicus TaxID=172040 RepID=A0ABU1J9U9_9MICC|nr:urease accessory protein UreD [Arthrobacter russicus]MDR6269195.1 urease accessory protein [Arthrobacter russicus]
MPTTVLFIRIETAPAEQIGVGSRPTRIRAELRNGVPTLTLLDRGEFLAARPVHSTGAALRVALIGVRMMLLGGDAVRLEVTLGPGISLELVEPAGLVAYDADGEGSSWTLSACLGPGSALVYHGAPFVVSAGANVDRRTEIELAPAARLLLRETLVAGRAEDAGGGLRMRNRVWDATGEFLVEDLHIRADPFGQAISEAAVLGSSKVIDSVLAAGFRPGVSAPPQRGIFILEREGCLFRSLADGAAEAAVVVEPVFEQWREQLLG